MLISDADANSFECLSARAHFCRFVSNVSARVLISDADANSFECLSSRVHFCRFVWNVSARVFISSFLRISPAAPPPPADQKACK